MKYTLIARASYGGSSPIVLVANQSAQTGVESLRAEAKNLLATAHPGAAEVAMESQDHYFM